MAETNADVTIVHREPKTTTRQGPAAPSSAFAKLQASITSIASDGDNESADLAAEGQRWPSVETRWLQVDALINEAVARVNAVLAPVGLAIGPAGETSWSLKNRGFGAYRRLEVDGRSLAWLRTDINQEQTLILKVRAHDPQLALLNATEDVAVGRATPNDVLEALSRVIRPAGEFSAWSVAHGRKADTDDRSAWAGVARTASEAFIIAQGALKEVGATLVETQKPTWDPASGGHRWMLAVGTQNTRAADITVDLAKHGLEIASQTAVAHRQDLSRKRRLDLNGLDSHALAEAIAACAWPAVASVLQQTQVDPV